MLMLGTVNACKVSHVQQRFISALVNFFIALTFRDVRGER